MKLSRRQDAKREGFLTAARETVPDAFNLEMGVVHPESVLTYQRARNINRPQGRKSLNDSRDEVVKSRLVPSGAWLSATEILSP